MNMGRWRERKICGKAEELKKINMEPQTHGTTNPEGGEYKSIHV